MPKNVTKDILEIMDSNATSFWLKNALRASLRRDPVDAWKDAKRLADILERRMDRTLAPKICMDLWNTRHSLVGTRVLCQVAHDESEEALVLAVSRRDDGIIKVQMDDGEILVGNQWEEL